MRAIICSGHGGEDVMRIAELAAPVPGPGELAIRVVAAGVNRADLLQRRGLYPPPEGASPVLGLECAGRVSALGDGVAGFREGDRVMALLTGGGYAEEVVVAAGCVRPVPDRLSDVEAAAVPEAFLTAFLNLFQLGGLGPGERVLVHGGSGGVGTAAIQLAVAAGARVMVTAGSAERCRRCAELGAERAVDYHHEDFAAAAREWSEDAGLGLILDCIGGPYLARHLDVLATDGRLVLIGLMGGARAEIDLRLVLSRRLQLLGSTLRARSTEFKTRLFTDFNGRFGAALAAGGIRPVVDRTLPLEEAPAAHRMLAAGEILGKLILET